MFRHPSLLVSLSSLAGFSVSPILRGACCNRTTGTTTSSVPCPRQTLAGAKLHPQLHGLLEITPVAAPLLNQGRQRTDSFLSKFQSQYSGLDRRIRQWGVERRSKERLRGSGLEIDMCMYCFNDKGRFLRWLEI